jgi:hypothetical protein
VADNDYLVGTGFAGTPALGAALTKIGGADDFYSMLLQTEVPSWLYQVAMNGTTTWERWNSLEPNGSVNAGEMTSFSKSTLCISCYAQNTCLHYHRSLCFWFSQRLDPHKYRRSLTRGARLEVCQHRTHSRRQHHVCEFEVHQPIRRSQRPLVL